MNINDIPNNEIWIEGLIKFPGRLIVQLRTIRLQDIAASALSPLPVNHDVPWDIESKRIAIEQCQARRQVITVLAERLATEILRVVESQDPHRGIFLEHEEGKSSTMPRIAPKLTGGDLPKPPKSD